MYIMYNFQPATWCIFTKCVMSWYLSETILISLEYFKYWSR